jgi:hypothetical protein
MRTGVESKTKVYEDAIWIIQIVFQLCPWAVVEDFYLIRMFWSFG